MILWFW